MKCLAVLILSLTAPAVAFAAPPEVRGTWLATTDSAQAIASPTKTAESMRRLREIGLNTVYVECWRNGYTTFPSDTLTKATGVTHKINLPGLSKTRDLLSESIIEAHRNGLLHFAWFADALVVATKEQQDGLRQKKPTWLLRDKDGGDVAPDGLVRLSPANDEARAFLIGIVVEAVTRYDLDGIAFDERLEWPDATMGYDEATRHAYMTESGGSPVPENVNDDPNWAKWRAAKVDEFVKELLVAVRKVRPDILISLGRPGGDDIVTTKWPKREPRDRVIADIAVVSGEGVELPWEDLERTIVSLRDQQFAGHLLSPASTLVDRYAARLSQFYDATNVGLAPHPKRAADWRPPPLVGAKRGGHWLLRVTAPGTYSVIVRRAGAWTETGRRRSAGNANVDIPDQKCEAVEMLLDRRSR